MSEQLNKRQKQVLQQQLDAEKAILEKLTRQYQRALNDIALQLRILESDELTQSKIYRIEYQKALKKQTEAILEKLHADQYSTIQQFLSDTYTDGFVGTAYDMHGQGVKLILPVDKNAAVKAVITDSQIKEGLYEALGVDTKKLKKTISSEITRGIASGMPHSDIARNIAVYAQAPLGRAKTIVRTEAHRIQEASAQDARKAAVSKGANVVKQWKAILDGKTRHSHRRLDGQIREVDEPYELGGKKAMYPGDFGDPAEDCNCRCRSVQRARVALNEDELKKLQDRAEFFGLDKSDDLEDFKKKYLGTLDEWASADAKTLNFLGADSRDNLTSIVKNGTIKMKRGFMCFPANDLLVERSLKVTPKEGFFDVAMHGSPSAVGFGTREANMSPRLLASVIRHSEGYNGENIRLLSCNTGLRVGDAYCFAEELANALGVIVEAPDMKVYTTKDGEIKVGQFGEGHMIPYKPNERRRMK